MFNMGMPELILILVLALVIFGPKKLPEVGKAVGNSLKEFKRATTDIQKSVEIKEESKPSENNQSKSIS